MPSQETKSALIFANTAHIGDLVLVARTATQLAGGLRRLDVGYIKNNATEQLLDIINAKDIGFVRLPNDIATPYPSRNALLRGVQALPHILRLYGAYDKHYLCHLSDVRYFPKLFPDKLVRLALTPGTGHNFIEHYTALLANDHGHIINPSADISFDTKPHHEKEAQEWKKSRGVGTEDEYVVMNLNTSNPLKNWPIRRFAELTKNLTDQTNLKVFYVNSPTNKAGLENEGLNPNHVMTDSNHGLPPLAQSIELIRGARAYIGADTGLTHIASTIGTPLVAIFRNEYRGLWDPVGDKRIIRVLSDTSPVSISVQQAYSTLSDLFQQQR